MKPKRFSEKSMPDPVLQDATQPASSYPYAAAAELKPIPVRYPVELVASLAVRLVKGNDYSVAARTALELIDACEAAITKHEKEQRTAHENG
jgi:hypothetical protein